MSGQDAVVETKLFLEALQAALAHRNSRFADALRAGDVEGFFAHGFARIKEPKVAAAVCAYFAERGGYAVANRSSVFDVLNLIRDEHGTTGYLVRKALAGLLGHIKPSEEEVEAHAVARMRRQGVIPLAPEELATGEVDEEKAYFAAPIREFLADAELWEER